LGSVYHVNREHLGHGIELLLDHWEVVVQDPDVVIGPWNTDNLAGLPPAEADRTSASALRLRDTS
jgi:hypothetical protein